MHAIVINSESVNDQAYSSTSQQQVEKEDPKVAATIAKALNEVTQLREVLKSLGNKPDHETLDEAKKSLAEIESRINNLEAVVAEPCPHGFDPADWRAQQLEKVRIAKEAAQKEKFPFKAVIQLYEMFEEYENLLKDAEQRLAQLTKTSDDISEDLTMKEETDEEVVEILQRASEKDVDSIYLKGRMLRHIPEAFGKFTTLKMLDLSSNQLEVLPDSIAGTVNLEELYLNNNVLKVLPDTIGFLKSLKILNVSRNKLTELPDSISECSALIELDASFNALAYLPTRLGVGLINLQKLDVHLNKLRYLPSSVCGMKSLKILNVHFNELRSVPLAIGKLQNLEVLNVGSNFSDLTSIPETIGDLMNLIEVDLSNNQIKVLPYAFGRLTNLKKINLDQNPLVIPPQDVIAQGSEAIVSYMAKRWVNYLVEEERRSLDLANETPTEQSWIQRGTNVVGGWLSGVAGNLGGYLGTNKKSPADDLLNQQF